MQHARDIAVADFLEAVRRGALRFPYLGATRWDVADHLRDITGIEWHERVILAKFRRFRNRGLMTGCDCGCRGDWKIIHADPS